MPPPASNAPVSPAGAPSTEPAVPVLAQPPALVQEAPTPAAEPPPQPLALAASPPVPPQHMGQSNVIYSYNSRNIKQNRRLTKLANVGAIIFIILFIGGLVLFWTWVGSPTSLEDLSGGLKQATE